MNKSRNIVFVCSEALPYAKSGGLADVCGSLPAAFSETGTKVSVIMPFYPQLMGSYNDKVKVRYEMLAVPFCGRTEFARILEHYISPSLSFYFIEYHKYFDRPSLYDWNGIEYVDNAERFAFFCLAAMESVRALRLHPDIMHLNDWHTALCCVYLKSPLYSGVSNFRHCASVLTIHNIGYQGNFDKSALSSTGLGWEYFNYHCLESYDRVNFLKGGIKCAHMVNTVSPTYALETLSPAFGYSLDSALRERAICGSYCGIINGIDTGIWNPETDAFLPKNYSLKDMKGKKVCKSRLQKTFKLPKRPEVPVFGTVSRLAYQKGIDVFAASLDRLLPHDDFQFVVIGTGEPGLQTHLVWLASKYPHKLSVKIGYSEEVAHLIEAGSDFFVMPSRYEPCGLNQMYSMVYGTAPVVRATGGLDDTVSNFDSANPEKSTGFKFWDMGVEALTNTIRWAADTYKYKPREFRKMQANAMSQDFSWRHTAALYQEMFEDAIKRISI